MLLQMVPLLRLGANVIAEGTFIVLGSKVISDRTFITFGSKCYCRWADGPLLHLGPVITLVPSTRDTTTTKFKSTKGNSLFLQSFKFVNCAWTLLNMSLV